LTRFLPLLFLLGCGSHRMFKKEYITLSESPCIDGTILNIDQAGCESFYWGTDPTGVTLKVRCTYAPKHSFWSGNTFFAVPHGYEPIHSNWGFYCEDRYVKMYALPQGTRFEAEVEDGDR
jgi:hypothetical protein